MRAARVAAASLLFLLVPWLGVGTGAAAGAEPRQRYHRPEGGAEGPLKSMVITNNLDDLTIELELIPGRRMETVFIYFDLDLDPKTGNTYEGNFGPSVDGWELHLAFGEPYFSGEGLGFVIIHQGDIFSRTVDDGQMNHYYDFDGWVAPSPRGFRLTIPLSQLGNPEHFDFVVVDSARAEPGDVIKGRYQVFVP